MLQTAQRGKKSKKTASEKPTAKKAKVHERFVTELIEEAQRSGQADASLDARVLSNCIFGTLIWTYKWYHPGGKVSREKLASVCSEFVLRGVIGEAPKSRPRKAKR